VIEKLLALDAALVAAGFPAMSPWWKSEIARFLESGRRRWVIRAGRRAGKSTTLTRLGLAHALFGAWDVPRGDTATIVFVSVSKDEASARLRTLADLLAALRIPFDRRGDEIEIASPRRVVFRVVACNTSAVVGFTSIAIFCDEVARWEDRDHAANPAAAVVGSLAPTMATQDAGFIVLGSTPWTRDDFHAESFERGDDAHQITSYGPSWECNPTLTEERTHELEPDPAVWQREYLAIPSDATSDAFDGTDVARAFEHDLSAASFGPSFIVIDASSMAHDRFTFARGRVTKTSNVLAIDQIGHFPEGATLQQITRELQAMATRVGATLIIGDQREVLGLKSMADFVSIPWTNANKVNAVARVRRYLRENALAIESGASASELIRREMLSFQQKLLPSGSLTYAGRRGGHDDFVALLITAAMALDVGHVAESGWTYADLVAKGAREWHPGGDDGLEDAPDFGAFTVSRGSKW
jgi:hypothetical protein